MKTLMSMMLLASMLAVSTLPTTADAARGCREGCPRGYVWDGCSCR